MYYFQYFCFYRYCRTYIQAKQGYDQEDVLSGWLDVKLLESNQWDHKVPLVTFNSSIVYFKFNKYHDGDAIDYLDASGNEQSGFGWHEMYNNQTSDSIQKDARDALSIMASFLSHCDNFDGNQGFYCLDDPKSTSKMELSSKSKCSGTPFLYIHDIGASLGYGWNLRHKDFWPNYIDLKQWMEVPVWGDLSKCEVYVNGIPGCSWRGNLAISEGGRSMVSRLLSKLTDDQIAALFSAARPNLMRGDSLESWIQGFKDKMASEIFNKACKM